jgi:PhnB protein
MNVTAYLCANGAAKAIEFYREAFGAEELYRMEEPDGRIGHCEMRIGETVLYLSDEWPEMRVLAPVNLGGHSVSFVLSVEDADAAYVRAVEAGADPERPLKDEPYGRVGWVTDPFGHRWSIMAANPHFHTAQMKEPTAAE